MKMSFSFLGLLLLLPLAAQSAVIGLKQAVSDSYLSLNLTARGEIEFSKCPQAENPVVNCDPSGNATWLVDKNVFYAALDTAAKFDSYSISENQNLSYQQDRKASYENYLKQSERQIAEQQKKLDGLAAQIAFLEKQIQEVTLRLKNQTGLDPQDVKELETYKAKSTEEVNRLKKLQKDEQKKQDEYKQEKREEEKQLAEANREIAERQTSIAKRKALLDQKSAQLKQNLEAGQVATVFENESLYFMAFFAFTSETPAIPDAQTCELQAWYKDVYGTVKSTVAVSAGLYPKKIQVNGTWLDFYNGADYDTRYSSPKDRWKVERVDAQFKGPRSGKTVTCSDREIAGYLGDYFWWNVFDGKRLYEDSYCNDDEGYRPFERTYIKFISLGRMTQQKAAEACAGLKAEQIEVSGAPYSAPRDMYSTKYKIPPTLFGDAYFQDGTLESKAVNAMAKEQARILQRLSVTGVPDLQDGLYAWASADQAQLIRFLPDRAPQLIDLRGTALENASKTWQMPVLCSVRIENETCKR